MPRPCVVLGLTLDCWSSPWAVLISSDLSQIWLGKEVKPLKTLVKVSYCSVCSKIPFSFLLIMYLLVILSENKAKAYSPRWNLIVWGRENRQWICLSGLFSGAKQGLWMVAMAITFMSYGAPDCSRDIAGVPLRLGGVDSLIGSLCSSDFSTLNMQFIIRIQHRISLQ